MRISPIGFLFNTEEDVIKHAKEATIPSHNSNEAIASAETITLIIFYARKGLKNTAGCHFFSAGLFFEFKHVY